MKTPPQPAVSTSEAVAARVAARRAAEQRVLELREARRQRRLAARRAADEARAAARFPADGDAYAENYLWPFALAEFAARGIARMAASAARALHRAYCVRRETRTASALGTPTPADIAAVWVPPRRTLRQALLIGSRLVDLSATHPDTRKWTQEKPGAKRRTAGRAGGLRQYFKESCPTVRYSTAMRYRQLARRVLRVLDTPAAIPLEWLLAEEAPDALTADAALAGAIRDGRRRLEELLIDVRSQRDLTRVLDRRFDSDRLPLSHRGTDPVRDMAACEAILVRCEAKLRDAVASKRPLTRPEKEALALLKRLDRFSMPLHR